MLPAPRKRPPGGRGCGCCGQRQGCKSVRVCWSCVPAGFLTGLFLVLAQAPALESTCGGHPHAFSGAASAGCCTAMQEGVQPQRLSSRTLVQGGEEAFGVKGCSACGLGPQAQALLEFSRVPKLAFLAKPLCQTPSWS